MAPAWESVGAEFAADSSIVIGQVDCTATGALCERFGVEAYPQLKFKQAGDDELQDYEGEMGREDLLSAAKSLLQPSCTPANRAACSETQLSELERYLAMSPEALESLLDETAAPLKDAKEKLVVLEDRLDKLEEKVDAQEEEVKTLKESLGPKIRLLKATLKGAAAPKEGKDEV